MTPIDAKPDWFGPATTRVLEGLPALMEADGPRALEQRTAELLGAELHRAITAGHGGLWFDGWVENLADSAVQKIFDGLKHRSPSWEAAWRLLCGLDGIAPPWWSGVRTAMRKPKRKLRAAAAWHRLPEWLELMPKLRCTGEVWETHDAYGTRFAVVAGFEYAGGVDPHYYLLDIDAAGFVGLAYAGTFDTVAQACGVWRGWIGENADAAEPTPVSSADRLLCLVHCDLGAESGQVIGHESREVMDNWFRAVHRLGLLAQALEDKGMPLPEKRSLFIDLDVQPAVEDFAAWYESRHGTPPDRGALEWLVEEWLEGTLPGTEHAIPPKRIEHHFAIIEDDWADGPAKSEALRVVPDWVQWNGERSSTPDHLVKESVAAAERGSQPK